LYTTVAAGVSQTTGVALVEVYDVTAGNAAESQLTSISSRAVVGTGDNILIPGVIFTGGGSTRVLIRAVGPTLGEDPFLVGNVLADPQVELHSSGTRLASNDDWGNASNADEIRTVSDQVSAFPLPEGSRDAVLLPTLVQGAYTITVSGKNGATGVVLVELYIIGP
jgi:hypothetical protein